MMNGLGCVDAVDAVDAVDLLCELGCDIGAG